MSGQNRDIDTIIITKDLFEDIKNIIAGIATHGDDNAAHAAAKILRQMEPGIKWHWCSAFDYAFMGDCGPHGCQKKRIV